MGLFSKIGKTVGKIAGIAAPFLPGPWGAIATIGAGLLGGRSQQSNIGGMMGGYGSAIQGAMGNITPFNVSTGAGDLTYDASTGTMRYAPTASIADYARQLTGAEAGQRLAGLLGGGGQDFTKGVVQNLRDLASPYEERQKQDLEAKLLRQGMLTSSEGGYQTQGLYDALSTADRQRQLQAYDLREKLLSGEIGRMQAGRNLYSPDASLLNFAGLGSTNRAHIGAAGLSGLGGITQKGMELSNRAIGDKYDVIRKGIDAVMGSGLLSGDGGSNTVGTGWRGLFGGSTSNPYSYNDGYGMNT